MRLGKLSAEELQKNIIDKLKPIRRETILSAAQGEDCAALDIDGTVLLSSDPITCSMPIEHIGSLSVNVCCNDILANGGEPIALMMTLILPPTCNDEDVSIIMNEAVKAARAINVDIVGGHTEFSDCVTRPIVSATAIGSTKKLLAKFNMKVGEKLLVTKYIGIEGTSIILDGNDIELSEKEKEVKKLFSESISVYSEGNCLRKLNVSMMHDITEGGVFGAVAEVCRGNGLGANLYEKKIPLHPLTARICNLYKLNPYKLISSGSMLFSTNEPDTAISELGKLGIMVTEIGEVTAGDVVVIDKTGKKTSIIIEPDEMYFINKR